MSDRLVVTIGNADAVELQQIVNPDTGEQEAVWRRLEGERVTTVNMQAGLSPLQQVQTVIRLLQEMMVPGARPWWIECDDETLRTMLCSHYGIPPSRTRPVMWGDGSTIRPPEESDGGTTKKRRRAPNKQEQEQDPS